MKKLTESTIEDFAINLAKLMSGEVRAELDKEVV